jgi:hypothetical protein
MKKTYDELISSEDDEDVESNPSRSPQAVI